MTKKITYKDAGVNIDAANESTKRIKEHVKKTFDSSVVIDMGTFAGAVNLEKLKKYKNPVLVSSIDGVGTKLMIASMMNKWDTIGKDIVGHCANDILSVGGEPLFFLDYIASASMKPEIIEQIVKGMSHACRENGIPLVAGETAEMPGVYREGEHDIVGCIVGVAEKDRTLDGSKIKEDDVIVGVASDGLHTNGYSLARKVLFDVAGFSVDQKVGDFDITIGEELLRPHRSYVRPVLDVMSKFEVRGMAHITGGGLIENIPRILPDGLAVEIQKASLNPPEIFHLIKEKGNVPEHDMYRTFNMGVGMVLIVPEDDGIPVLKRLKELKEEAGIIGRVVHGEWGVKLI
ncbi:MAG: phosphoribosylformylglycinamidine cyclo-ligase [Candidatus Aenigmatarchaeota archaeon]|nr:MAG: phosphoribosylformylglycinamidine cyclo-ligase [Candidatus Aenigmarchaeota archaeon]